MTRTIIGLDGGGTSTRATVFALTDEGPGDVLARADAGSSNLNSTSREQVQAHLRALRDQLDLTGAVACGMGAAGISYPGVAETLAEMLEQLGFPAPVAVIGDQAAALKGALGQRPGILLVAGTGSIAAGQDARGQVYRAGGYGHMIDDGGSAYDIGRRLLSAYVKAYDGRAPRTPLIEALEAALAGEATTEAQPMVDKDSAAETEPIQPADRATRALARVMELAYAVPFDKGGIASLAPILEPFLEEGDPTACRIADEGVRALLELTDTLAAKLGTSPIPVVPAGGLLLKNAPYRARFLEALEASDYDYRPEAAEADATAGAAFHAWEVYHARHARETL